MARQRGATVPAGFYKRRPVDQRPHANLPEFRFNRTSEGGIQYLPPGTRVGNHTYRPDLTLRGKKGPRST